MIFRSKIVAVRMTPEEHDQVLKYIDEKGFVLSEFIRLCVLSRIKGDNATEGRKLPPVTKK